MKDYDWETARILDCPHGFTFAEGCDECAAKQEGVKPMTALESETPLTDAECGPPRNGDDTWPSCYVTADFARTMERRCKRLEEALRQYGTHDEECVRGIGRPCTCGFAEVLPDQKEEKA